MIEILKMQVNEKKNENKMEIQRLYVNTNYRDGEEQNERIGRTDVQEKGEVRP